MIAKKRKILIIVLSIVLVIAIAAGSAFAIWWFSDEPAKRGKKKKVVIVKKYPTSSVESSDDGDMTSSEDESSDYSFNDTSSDDISEDNNSSDNNSKDNDSFEESTNEDEIGSDDEYEDKRDLYEEPEKATVTYKKEYTVTPVEFDGLKDYVIVYADGNKKSENLANLVKDYFKENTKITLKVVSDKQKEQKKEIIIGNTTRYKSKLAENKYEVKLSENKLIFDGGHFAMVEKSVDWFVSLKYELGKVNTLKGETADFVAKKDGGYIYVWGDEFSGSKLDNTKWVFANRMAGTALLETRRDEEVASVSDDNLKLRAIRSFRKENPIAQYATTQSINTMKNMSFMQGYLEMYARVPFVSGAWPSLWANSNGALNNTKSKPYTVEVDIFEVFSSVDTLTPNIHKWRGQDKASQYNVDHYVDGVKTPATNYVFENTDNLVNEYHLYGFKWTETEMIMSVDGDEYMTFDLTKDFDNKDGMEGYKVPLSLLINNHMFTSDTTLIAGASNVNNIDLPYEYDIDWIRLYQIPGQGILNLAE